MDNNKAYPNPFGWNEIEQQGLTTFYEQRQASYKTPAQETYTGNAHEAFYDNFEAPTPQLAMVDGYKSEKEIEEENGESETPEQSETVETPEVKEEEEPKPEAEVKE